MYVPVNVTARPTLVKIVQTPLTESVDRTLLVSVSDENVTGSVAVDSLIEKVPDHVQLHPSELLVT